jgi:hypothetical protein
MVLLVIMIFVVSLGFAFIITFFKTIHKEWHGIDRLRMDKFYLVSKQQQQFFYLEP